MATSLSPFFRSPFTDLTAGLISHQIFGRCAIQEMQLMDCLEAYGLDRGLAKCKCYIDDFKECQLRTKQFSRFMEMRKERDRQIHCGILTGDKKYHTPRIDSY